MAVNLNVVNAYNAYRNSYKGNAVTGKQEVQEGRQAQDTRKTQGTDTHVSKVQKNLSRAAQDLLERLKSENPEMDFMVADFESEEEAQEILSRGTKEFSVLLTGDELEKMAADEAYYEESMNRLDEAVRMAEEISEKYSAENGSEAEITKIGIAFNSDGTTTIFAELEKVSAKQRERMEAARAERAEAKKEEAGKAEVEKAEESVKAGVGKEETKETVEKPDGLPAKRVVVRATSQEELLQKISEIDWNAVKPETPVAGAKFDFTV